MTRKTKTMEQLEDLIRAFYFNDTQMKEYKKISEEEKAQIKDLMKAQNLTEKVVDGLKAKYIVANSESINEDKLLPILKEYGLTQCIKTIEVVDMDELENAIYHKEVPNNVLKKMETCRETKSVVKLQVSKV